MDPATDGPAIRARLGVVPQEDNLDLELTVYENLLIYGRYFGMSRAAIKERAAELLDFVQLTERRNDQVDPLSGGLKRRLTIARSLVSGPDLLLLDEPTTGLDPQARHVLWDRLYRLKQSGVTLVLTTHYMDEAEQLCDRLVVMDKARIVAEGSPRQLIAEHSSREVVELRFEVDEQDAALPALEGIAERIEPLPDRVLLYVDDGDKAAAVGPRPGPRPRERGGAPQHARGRLPPPHRPDPGRLMASAIAVDQQPTHARARRSCDLRASRSATDGPGAARWSARSSTRCCSCWPWGSASASWSTTRTPAGSRASRTCRSSDPACWPRPPCRWPRASRPGR